MMPDRSNLELTVPEDPPRRLREHRVRRLGDAYVCDCGAYSRRYSRRPSMPPTFPYRRVAGCLVMAVCAVAVVLGGAWLVAHVLLGGGR